MTALEPAELRTLLELALEAARRAGEVILPLYREGIRAELKADATPVTEADRRAELVLREFFARETPAFGFLGEEFGDAAGEAPGRWIVDPIDGTKAFVHRVPLFGTLIALEWEGASVLGVIACHAVGETAWAARGLGASLDGQPCRVSSVETLETATVLATDWRAVLERPGGATVFRRARLARTWGDCYGYLLVAAGRAEVMLDPELNLWDVAALEPIITEAGGRLADWPGAPAPRSSAVAANASLADEVVRLLSA